MMLTFFNSTKDKNQLRYFPLVPVITVTGLSVPNLLSPQTELVALCGNSKNKH